MASHGVSWYLKASTRRPLGVSRVSGVSLTCPYTSWSILAFPSVFWHLTACPGASWRSMSWRLLPCLRVCWRLLARPGMFWRVVACPGVPWHVLASPGVSWRLLASPGVSLRLPTSAGVSCRFPARAGASCHALACTQSIPTLWHISHTAWHLFRFTLLLGFHRWDNCCFGSRNFRIDCSIVVLFVVLNVLGTVLDPRWHPFRPSYHLVFSSIGFVFVP